jgi:hypothetical protein
LVALGRSFLDEERRQYDEADEQGKRVIVLKWIIGAISLLVFIRILAWIL